MMNDVALDGDPHSPVHVDAVRAPVGAVRWIAERGDVVNSVAADQAVARLIDAWVGRCPLEADGIDADIVVVVNDVVRHAPELHVSVDGHGLARTGFQSVQLVAVNHEIVDRSRRLCAVDDQAERVAIGPGFHQRLDVVDAIRPDLNVVP